MIPENRQAVDSGQNRHRAGRAAGRPGGGRPAAGQPTAGFAGIIGLLVLVVGHSGTPVFWHSGALIF